MAKTNNVTLKINNIPVTVPAGTTIIEAARSIGIEIPSLCYFKDLNQIGACRICVVEVKGARGLVTACVYPVSEGMEVFTNTQKVLHARKRNLELLLSDHDRRCTSCDRSGKCELQALANQYGCDDLKFNADYVRRYEKDESTDYLVRDNNKCVFCRRCEAVCKQVQQVAVIGGVKRGFEAHIGCAYELPLNESPCVACGQCITVCPTGALTEKNETDNVIKALADPTKHVVVGTAPAVRAAIGEEFGMPIGTDAEGEMVAALRRMGFAKVFDVDFAADLTIMEEGTEFLTRATKGGVLPLITSCSPGWIRYAEYYYPELLPHISTCKSPQQMFGATIKTYYAQKFNIPADSIYVVSVMPCVAKKFEKTRQDQAASGNPDVDCVITTRELATLIKRYGMDLTQLPKEKFDDPLGEGSGAGVIFGATGGVMEAALRTVAEVVTGKPLTNLEFKDVRGTKGIKEATYNLNGKDYRVCVVHGIANTHMVMEQIKNGSCNYDFIEVMTCPGGCVNGGGQPIQPASVHAAKDIKALRAKALYKNDAAKTLRKSHENPFVKAAYEEFFGEPNSKKAHEILHTHYVARKQYPQD